MCYNFLCLPSINTITLSAMLSSKMDGRITHDPFHLQFGGSNMFVDLGA